MTHTDKRSSRNGISLKGVLQRALLVLGSLVVTVLVIEFAVRLLPAPYRADEGNVPLFSSQADLFVCDNVLGWSGVPSFQGVVELPGITSMIKANAMGMHDSDHRLEKPPNTIRVLMLGDSFVHAIQVEEGVTAHQVLEEQLNDLERAGKLNYEVISGGMTGWGTGQELVYYRQQGRSFEPDLVLLMLFLGNDLENNLPGNVLTIGGRNCYAPYFAQCEAGLHPDPLKYAPGVSDNQRNCTPARRLIINTLGTLYQHSRLYQQLEPLIISQRPRQLFGAQYPNPFWALYIPNEDQELEQAWQVTQGLILQLRQEVEADGASFAVVFFPWSVIIELDSLPPERRAAILDENPTFKAAELDRPNTYLAEFLSRHGIPFIDLTPLIVQEQKAQDTLLHFVGDGHWTVEGNRFIAEELTKWMVEQGLVPE